MLRSLINSNAFPALRQLRLSVFDKRTIALSEPRRFQSTNPIDKSNPSPTVKYSFYCSVDDPVSQILFIKAVYKRIQFCCFFNSLNMNRDM